MKRQVSSLLIFLYYYLSILYSDKKNDNYGRNLIRIKCPKNKKWKKKFGKTNFVFPF